MFKETAIGARIDAAGTNVVVVVVVVVVVEGDCVVTVVDVVSVNMSASKGQK